MKIIAKIKNSKSGGLIIELEKNGFQILVRHENLHKIGHVNANYGKNGTTCPPSNDGDCKHRSGVFGGGVVSRKKFM